MTRYTHHDYGQSKLIPVHFDRQVLPGTFEYTLSYLIEHACDLSWFEARYRYPTWYPECDLEAGRAQVTRRTECVM